MKRLVIKPGDIFEFPLSKAGAVGYAQWLADGTARFFLYSGPVLAPAEAILKLPQAFRVFVYKDTPRLHGWAKVGKATIPEELESPLHYAMKDAISGKLSVYYEGAMRPATEDDVRGLETAAVWAHAHVIERLEAQLSGRSSEYLASLAVA